ncbi:MAG: metal-dependent hydrolase [Bacteroidota bacterium]
MQITYFGHACFEILIGGKKLLFDPFITPNELAKDIDINRLKPDYILLSHGHQDHVADVEVIYKNSEAKIIANFEVVSWFGERGCTNGHPMNHGGQWEFDFGSVKMVNAVHSSNMPDGSYGGNPAGFVVKSEDETFYYAGDTALHYDMKLIQEEFDIDVAFLPIGDNFTMGINDAVKATQFVGASTVIAMHFDTFPYIKTDHEEAKRKFSEQNIGLVLLEIGSTTNL